MTTTQLKVQGMTCGHCVQAVSDELSALDGVTSVRVDLEPGAVSLVTVESSAALADADVSAAIDEAGYELVDPQAPDA